MIKSLNGYRFLAFLMVFLYHVNYIDFGYLGVQAFFVLSGFLITPILVKTKETKTNLLSYLKNFLTRRFLRIFPLYYAYLFFLFLVIVIFSLDVKSDYFLSLKDQLIYGFTYTYNFYHQSIFFQHNSFISHFWSLAVEEQFYLVWPFLIFYIPRKYLRFSLIIICFVTPFLRYLISMCVESNCINYLSKEINLVVYLSTFSHLDAFAIGGVFGISNNLKINTKCIFLFITSIIFFGLIIDFFNNDVFYFSSLGYGKLMEGSYKYIWGYSLVNIIFALILIGLKHRVIMKNIFENKFMNTLGIISYGLYVYHFGIVWIFNYIKTNIYVHMPKFFLDLIALILTVFISYFSFYFFEIYFINLKDKFAPKNK